LTVERRLSDVVIVMKHDQTIIFIGKKDANHVMIEVMPKVVAGWRSANIVVRCGVWTGHYEGQFLVGELTKFGKEIEDYREKVKPAAALNSVEHYLQIRLSGEGHGPVHVSGEARERLGAKTALVFEFEMDRGALADVARGLMEGDRLE